LSIFTTIVQDDAKPYLAAMTPSKHLVVITGGSRGLGRSAALHLARAGVDSIFTYRDNLAQAQATVAAVAQAGATAVALQLDVADASSLDAFAAAVRDTAQRAFGRTSIDALINNAGHGLTKGFTETTEAELDALYAVHLKAPFLLTQRLLPLIVDGGRILNLSTGLARFALHGYSAYAAMKGGVEVLTRYLAKELGARRITVNVLAPGAIETDFDGGHVRDNAQLNQIIASATALGRVGKPDDIGGVVVALLCGETHWINGQRIEASGGQAL
jgi:NAD(P)-dependent dehydrogenase (short-subunit alcohol dehydrogenase family)